jgi:PKD repeat protein
MVGIKIHKLFLQTFVHVKCNLMKGLISMLLICLHSKTFALFPRLVDSSLVSNPSNYSYRPFVLFKSSDPLVPENPKKLVISADFKNIYFLGKKGFYTIDLKTNATVLAENKVVVSQGINATASLFKVIATDSSRSIAMNFQNQVIKLNNVYKNSLSGPDYFQGRTSLSNIVFPYSNFIAIDYRGYQSNNFDIKNIVAGKDGFYYINAINDIFQTITLTSPNGFIPPVNVGGSDISGTVDIPTIYKFLDGKRIDGSDYNSSSSSPKIRKVGVGKCVFVDGKGNVYTIEADRLLKWIPNNNVPMTVAGGYGKGSALNQLNLNVDAQKPIDIDADDNIYINDYYNKRVVLWRKGATVGEVIISDKLSNIPNFYPNSIALDESKNVYVTDSGVNSQVLKFFNCSYLLKPSIQKTSSNELSTLNQGKVRWYLNSQFISGVNTFTFKPKISGFYKVQDEDINGCKSAVSDSIYYECAPAKPEIALVGKAELKVNLPIDDKLFANYNSSITNYGLVKFVNLSKNYSNATWFFPDGTTSNEPSPSKYFSNSGKYIVKLEVKNTKGESSFFQNILDISYPTRPNIVYNDLGNQTFGFKSFEKEGVVSWDFGDGRNSNESSPTHTYANPGVYTIKVNLQGLGYARSASIQINTNLNVDLVNGKVVDLPISNDQSIFNDKSGFQNDANFTGKINALTSQGIYPSYSFSSIKLPGCTSVNKNERIKIPNSNSMNELGELTFSGWFGLDPSVSMFPGDGSCGPNGRQVLFSKGGDGYGTSPPGFNCLVDVTDKKLSLLVEFSKKSGDFAINVPILLDTVKTEEKYETIYTGKVSVVNGFNSVEITQSPRLGPKESPFHHFLISFSKNRVKIFINGKKVFDDARTIYFDEINQQDIYVGAMGPKSTPVNSISNWYPFKGRIDRIKIFSRMLSDVEVNALYLEKNSNE